MAGYVGEDRDLCVYVKKRVCVGMGEREGFSVRVSECLLGYVLSVPHIYIYTHIHIYIPEA